MFGKGQIGKGCNFIILEEADWIILIPTLYIVGCFEWGFRALNLMFGGAMKRYQNPHPQDRYF
jgi:hypothetical protein